MLKTSKILASMQDSDLEDLPEEAINDDDEEDDEKYEQQLDEYIQDVHEDNIGTLQVCRCAAHTVQLCACDLIKDTLVFQKIKMCRKITKHVRKSSSGFRSIIADQKLSLPIIDGPTRWLSTYLMIDSIRHLKEVLPAVLEYITTSNNKTTKIALNLNSDFWSFIDAYCTLLKPVQQTIIKFQEEKLNYNEFFEYWIKMKLSIQSLSSSPYLQSTSPYLKKIRKVLLASITTREKKTTR
jgi:hypothetical protein